MQSNWWKEAVIYQIYPRSFNDSNGDGIGDLPGIIEKLDYLAWLGVDVLWLSPVFASPNDDNGYDISDYEAIMREFGSMADFEALLAGAHARGLRILLDLVINHSSDEHPWFQQSRAAKDNPYRDYYFWRPRKPNNWQSFFGGDAWTPDPATGEYYLHLFSRKQPDLNWENERLRQDIYRMMRFWLDKGVDGFRLDVIPFISKRLDFADADFSNFGQVMETVYANGPRIHEFLQEMHREVLSKYDMMTVGEAPGVPPALANEYVGNDRNELHMIFHFGHMTIDWGPGGRFDPRPWSLREFKAVIRTWDEAIGERGWLSVFLDNHDYARAVSRWGDDGLYRERSAQLLALLLLTLRGTPCIYQGQEIGMTNVAFPTIEDYRDIEALNYWNAALARGEDPDAVLQAIQQQGRDNARTPMQWDASPRAGFTSAGEAWIGVNPNYTEINVAAERVRPDGILHFYRRLIALRREHPTLVYGAYTEIETTEPALFAYRRYEAKATYTIWLNFSGHTHGLPVAGGRLLIGNYADAPDGKLRPWEARLYGP